MMGLMLGGFLESLKSVRFEGNLSALAVLESLVSQDLANLSYPAQITDLYNISSAI